MNPSDDLYDANDVRAANPSRAAIFPTAMNSDSLSRMVDPAWAGYVRQVVLPWVMMRYPAGQELLREVAPANELATEVPTPANRPPAEPAVAEGAAVLHVTAGEADGMLANELTRRFVRMTPTVVNVGSSELPFPDNHFDGAACLTTLHRLPTRRGQDQLLSELCRVLKPGSYLIGCDPLLAGLGSTSRVRQALKPIGFAELVPRIRLAGFYDIEAEMGPTAQCFAARKPFH
jgi:SAM-dependent methyltransferase